MPELQLLVISNAYWLEILVWVGGQKYSILWFMGPGLKSQNRSFSFKSCLDHWWGWFSLAIWVVRKKYIAKWKLTSCSLRLCNLFFQKINIWHFSIWSHLAIFQHFSLLSKNRSGDVLKLSISNIFLTKLCQNLRSWLV